MSKSHFISFLFRHFHTSPTPFFCGVRLSLLSLMLLLLLLRQRQENSGSKLLLSLIVSLWVFVNVDRNPHVMLDNPHSSNWTEGNFSSWMETLLDKYKHCSDFSERENLMQSKKIRDRGNNYFFFFFFFFSFLLGLHRPQLCMCCTMGNGKTRNIATLTQIADSRI